MRAIRITRLDFYRYYPVDYILKSSGLDEVTGCCPKAFYNFFGLLGEIKSLNSDFLFWLQGELYEGPDQITPASGIKAFIRSPIFKNLDCVAGLNFDSTSPTVLSYLCDGWVLFSVLYLRGVSEPSHCVVFHVTNGMLFMGSEEITPRTFVQYFFSNPQNRYILGRPKLL